MKLDREYVIRLAIYAFVICALGYPLVKGVTVPPARMEAAERLFKIIEGIEPSKDSVAFIAMDFGPNTKAENEAQARVIIEHLMRRRIPFAVFSLYALAEPFLRSIPEGVKEQLEREYPGQKWSYGTDWVNLGYRPGGYLLVQSIPKSENLVDLFEKDVLGTRLSELPAFKNIRDIKQINFLGEFTGLVGMFDNYVQFFQTKDYRPLFGHGCTSITIPEAYIYLDSGQLNGLLEGIAGAAWYSKLLKDEFTEREVDSALLLNTSLGVAHLVIIFFVILGNVIFLISSRRPA